MADETAVAIGADVAADAAVDASTDAVDTTAADAVVDDAAAQTDDTQVADDQQQQSDVDTAVPQDAKIKAHIETLKKTDPALAKELKNLYFANQALKKDFPGGLAEAKKFLEHVQQLGGEEGIQQLNAERAEWKEIDEKFANGDASVLDLFAKENPEGFAKLIPQALDKLATLDRDTYNHALGSVFVSTLDSWRFADTMAALADNLSRVVDSNNQPLLTREVQAVQQLAKQYEGVKNLAAKLPEKKVDAAEQKIASERAALAAERFKMTTEHVSSATTSHAQKQYETLIGAEAKNQKLDIETLKKAGSYDRFIREIDGEVARAIVADKAAVQKIQSAIQAGKREDAVKLSNAKFDTVASKAVQKVVREWAMLMGPSRAKPAANGTTQQQTAGVKKLTEAPDTNLVDKTDPNWRTNYMMHSKAKLTTGQRVEW